MDKRYVINRVRSDLRDEVYDLMTHPGYHSLEKELTESLLNANDLYQSLRAFSRNRRVSHEEREARRQLFAYLIFREMNSRLGGFHFDRYKSFSTGEKQNELITEVLESLDFDEFLTHYESLRTYESELEFAEFAQTNQSRYLEDCITSSIKKNKVIPALSRAIAQDVVDALHLTENFSYLRVSEEGRQELFDFPEEPITDYVSLRKIALSIGGETCHVLLKRISRNSKQFRYLLTDFGALIRGL